MTLACVSVANAQAAAETESEYLSMEIADQFKLPSFEGIDSKDRDAITQVREKRNAISKTIRDTRTRVSDWLKGKAAPVSTTEVDNWFNGYVIPSMAQTDEETLSELGTSRKNLFRFYISFASNAQGRNQVIGLLIPKMQEIVEGNYHPVCRVNAMIVLSELNTREGSRTANRLPTPNAAILGYMRNAVKQDALPAYMKVPALSGIKRHAACRVADSPQAFSDQEARELISEMIDVFNIDPEQSEIDSDQITWMKRLAIQTIGFIGRPGDSGAAATLLRDIILDDEQDIRFRRDAIASYGMLDFRSDPEAADVRKVVVKIAELIAQSAENEAEYIDRTINDIKMTVLFLDGKSATSEDGKQKRGGVGLGQGADQGPGGGNNTAGNQKDIPEILPAYQRDLVRRRTQYSVWNGRYAIMGDERSIPPVRGLKDYLATDSEDKELIEQLVKDLDDLIAKTDIKVRNEDDEDEDEDVEPRDKSYADEMKDALAAGAQKIRATLKEHAPEEDAAEASGEAGESVGAGQ